mmetsp:Transcript_8790/g.39624  ORF Transcript_8790/g.39624 Transcript_8790/m.39624 type:complete len:275 (+) Transcript_8790:1755-2579(+)
MVGVLQIGDDGLHREAVLQCLLDRLILGSCGGVGGDSGSRVGDDGGHPVVAVVSLEIVPDLVAGTVGDALEAGGRKRGCDVGSGASIDQVDDLLHSLGEMERAADVVVGGLEVVGACVGGDGGDKAVGNVAGAGHVGGRAEAAESGGREAGGTHDGRVSEERVDVLLGDAVVVVVGSLGDEIKAEHPLENFVGIGVVSLHPGREDAIESLALRENIDDGIGADDGVYPVGVLEHVLGVEHLNLLQDDVVGGLLGGGVSLAVEGSGDEPVDLGLA